VQIKITVTGIVQGVGFRPFVFHLATKNHLFGYVRNKSDASVEIVLDGVDSRIKKFLRELKFNKPKLAQIHSVGVKELQKSTTFRDFKIYPSSKKLDLSGSIIPADISICEECQKELADFNDPRYNYFFVTCTHCGPRYTIINTLPYDRKNTTMQDFSMCNFCRLEYSNSLNRRFHAQTVSCPQCGPQVYLTNNSGELLEVKDPILEAVNLLSSGNIVAIKGYGGFHLATLGNDDQAITRLRNVKHRKQKPFAVMAKNLEVTKTFAEISQKEESLLLSFRRPIVLLKKRGDYHLSRLISPNLHNIGVMLPYTGLHFLLFNRVDHPVYVMTSANPPNQPIIKDDSQALARLGDTADYFLFYNRKISNRCDDSVLRVHGDNPVFIRRSRGYAPEPVILKRAVAKETLGLGGEWGNAACLFIQKKAFFTPHIGDVENIETQRVLKHATRDLIRFTNSGIEVIACDLHPKFVTTHLARKLAEKNNWCLVQVQHHFAHVAALMAENNLNEIVGICCDGYGYGLNGEAWGGEILIVTSNPLRFKRTAHLEKQPLIGGDLATKYPLRMAAGILSKKVNIEDWLLKNVKHFPHGIKEVQLMINQLAKGAVIQTTSCGRVLDAIAAVLEICFQRTYRGEPAIKLESLANGGKDILKLKPVIRNNYLDTTYLLVNLFENKDRDPFDLAYSAHIYLAKGLVELAIENALAHGIHTIGFSGGVACNALMVSKMKRYVEKQNLQFVVHKAIPPGDGGLAFGQAYAASHSL